MHWGCYSRDLELHASCSAAPRAIQHTQLSQNPDPRRVEILRVAQDEPVAVQLNRVPSRSSVYSPPDPELLQTSFLSQVNLPHSGMLRVGLLRPCAIGSSAPLSLSSPKCRATSTQPRAAIPLTSALTGRGAVRLPRGGKLRMQASGNNASAVPTAVSDKQGEHARGKAVSTWHVAAL